MSSSASLTNMASSTPSSCKKKRRQGSISEHTVTHFSSVLKTGLPPCPPHTSSAADNSGSSQLSKVCVAVKLKQTGDGSSASYLAVDREKRGQLILRGPPSNESNMAPSFRRQLAQIPKIFSFDNVFRHDAQQLEVCQQSMWDIVQSVIQGSDGCVISFGHTKTGKTHSLIGSDHSSAEFGIIPTCISWLYQLIEGQRSKTGARFSVRVSALEIRGKDEQLFDLLADIAPGQDGAATAPLCLKETQIYGAQLENLNELRAPDAERAGLYLDAALTSSQKIRESSDNKGAHLLLTLDIYQHHLEKPTPGGALVAGGRSRLHLIDIGPCVKSSSEGSALSLAALGSTIIALLNGQRQFPHKDSKLATLLKESVGNASCRTCILVHVASQPSQYAETLQILQLAARIHNMKVRRRNKFSSHSSDGSDSTRSGMRRRGIRMGTSASYSDPDVSSSEHSVDTVIHIKSRLPTQAELIYRENYHHERSPGHAIPVQAMNQSRGKSPLNHQHSESSVASPYKHPGSIKKGRSDDETSSEGRRRMPRTNARAWPRVNHNDSLPSKEQWVDRHMPPRDQWHIAGTANPTHAEYATPGYHNTVGHTQSQLGIPPPWMTLAQYSQVQNEGLPIYAIPGGPPEQAGATIYPETHKQELWVDGPTAFTKTIEGLTKSLQQDKQLSPTKRHRHHHHHCSGDERRKGRKHRESPRHHKHCHQCGADIRKEGATDRTQKHDGKSAIGDLQALPVKPFVKDWVIKHSKAKQNGDKHSNESQEEDDEEATPKHVNPREEVRRKDRIDQEIAQQEQLELTVDLRVDDADIAAVGDENECCEDLLGVSEYQRESITMDDSVSNVTADERVGYESKDGSSFDETSLGDETIEVCDAACQTEFTDSETQSNHNDLTTSGDIVKSQDSMDSDMRSNTLSRSVQNQSVDRVGSSTIGNNLLRRPDGASDPNLHKELISPTEITKPRLTSSRSSTLPRKTQLQSVAVCETINERLNNNNILGTPVKLQPYLTCSPVFGRKHVPLPTKCEEPAPAGPPAAEAEVLVQAEVSEKQASTLESSKVSKGRSFFSSQKSQSLDLAPSEAKKAAQQSPTKKPTKTSKLPSLLGRKDKSKVAQPTQLPRKTDSDTKKEKKSKPSRSKDEKATVSSPSLPRKGSASPNRKLHQFDAKVSPYRRYVLPRPSYATSDGYSDNSSCCQGRYKYSASSGYESMVINSTDDVSSMSCTIQDDAFKDGRCLGTASTGVTKFSENNNDSTDIMKTSVKLREYEGEDLDRLQIRRCQEMEAASKWLRHKRVEELILRQEELKKDLTEAKATLMVAGSTWSFDLHVASQRDLRDDIAYLEALEKETDTLQKRVDACKSRIMLVTTIL